MNIKYFHQLRFTLIITLLFIITEPVFSQKIIITEKNADCNSAIDISGRMNIAASAPISYGSINEISSNKGDIYYFENEHYTVWYSFVSEKDALLSFTISPDKATDDYDFILFECPTNDCCNGIKNKTIKPIRTNISRTKVYADGITGLNDYAIQEYVHEGKGDNFSKSVVIKKGVKYILLLDNVYGGTGGHSISFEYGPIKKERIRTTKPKLNLNIVENKTNKLLEADITIIHFDKDHNTDTTIKSGSSLFMPLNIGEFYELRIKKDNYLLEELSIRAHNDDSLITKTVTLTMANVGASFELKKLYFRGGTAQFTGQYKNILMKLLRVMKENPSLKIKIIGHVNRPNGSYRQKSEEYYNQLSIDRAKAVSDYLIKRGISENRLDFYGVGYSEMIYPDATKQSEMQKNRRVEIIVTDF